MTETSGYTYTKGSKVLVRPGRGWMVYTGINVSLSVNKTPGVGFLMIDTAG